MNDRVQIVVQFDNAEQAAYLHMFLRRCGFEEFYARTEPHLSAADRKERAYHMVHAAAKVEQALGDAGISSSVY